MITLIEFVETFAWVFPCILILFIIANILHKYVHIPAITNFVVKHIFGLY